MGLAYVSNAGGRDTQPGSAHHALRQNGELARSAKDEEVWHSMLRTARQVKKDLPRHGMGLVGSQYVLAQEGINVLGVHDTNVVCGLIMAKECGVQ